VLKHSNEGKRGRPRKIPLRKEIRESGNSAEGQRGIPNPCAVTVSEDALEKLSNATVDFYVRRHELVGAIVILTDGTGIRLNLSSAPNTDVGRHPSPVRVPTRVPARVFSRVLLNPESLPSLSGVPTESRRSPQDWTKPSKMTPEDSARVVSESSESLGSEELRPPCSIVYLNASPSPGGPSLYLSSPA